MSHRIVDPRTENFNDWLRTVVYCSAITAGPFLAAGIVNLLFVEAGPRLCAVADFALRYSGLGLLAGAAGVIPTVTTHVFNDDFGEGLLGLFKGLALAEATTVAVPLAVIAGSAWAVAVVHPNVATLATAVAGGSAEIAIFAAVGEAALLVLAWVAGRLLRR